MIKHLLSTLIRIAKQMGWIFWSILVVGYIAGLVEPLILGESSVSRLVLYLVLFPLCIAPGIFLVACYQLVQEKRGKRTPPQ